MEQKNKQDALGYSDKVNTDFVKAPAIAKKEEYILGLLLIYPEYRKKVFEEKLLDEQNFFTELSKRVFTEMRKAYEFDKNLPDFNENFTPEEVGRITKMKLTQMELEGKDEEVLLNGLLESISALKLSVDKKNAKTTNTHEGLNELLSKLRRS
jgi:hypothetical protein